MCACLEVMAMDFAERQLSKYGWEKGQGLGKRKSGISEPIKVKLKRDNSGVGSAPGSEFTSNWWDKVFNSAASGIKVKSDKGKVVIEANQDTSISLKKKHYDSHKRTLRYGGFLASTSIQEQQEMGVVREVRKPGSAAVGSGRELNTESGQKAMEIDDSLLLEACGGRTAHKGARHGLTLSGKLARIEQQEAAVAQSSSKTDKSSSKTDRKKKKAVLKQNDRTKRLKDLKSLRPSQAIS